MNTCKSITVAAVAALATVGLAAAPAQAASYTGKITAYVKDTSAINPYGVTLSSGPQVWLYTNTYFVDCRSVGISDGALISMTRLGLIKNASKTVTINVVSGTDYIVCH